MTRSRLKGLLGSVRSTPVAASKQYTELERLDVSLYEGHRSENVGEHLTLSGFSLDALDRLVDHYTTCNDRPWPYQCRIIRSTSNVGLWPVFREVLQHEGADNEIWDILYKRHALWTIHKVLGFLRDDIHQGDDRLGLTEHREVIFPVLLTETPHQNGSPRRSDRVGFLLVHQGRPIHQRRVWSVHLVEGEEIFSFERETIYFANNPGPAAK
ncbi:MAG: hypothetical protein KBD47_03440 [Candidatus Pacebacteria bacterium]|nr:hypothetical protein [Candidatus Paceibacterota bacterium]